MVLNPTYANLYIFYYNDAKYLKGYSYEFYQDWIEAKNIYILSDHIYFQEIKGKWV